MPSLSTILLGRGANNARRENILEIGLLNTIPQNARTKNGLYLETYSAPAILIILSTVPYTNVISLVKLSLLILQLCFLLVLSEAWVRCRKPEMPYYFLIKCIDQKAFFANFLLELWPVTYSCLLLAHQIFDRTSPSWEQHCLVLQAINVFF